MFDEVVVAVLGNPAKRSGLFSIPQRVELVAAATAHFGNVRCVGFHGSTVDLARAEGTDVLVRAAHKETANERSMAAVNEQVSGIQTFFASPDPATWTISSSAVRGLVAAGEIEAAAELVPADVRAAIRALVEVGRRDPSA